MTLWTYLMVFDYSVSRSDVLDAVDDLPDAYNWYTCFPNAVFIVAGVSAWELSDKIKNCLPSIGRFVILDTNTDRQGRLPKSAWSLIGKPRAVEGTEVS